MEPQLSSTDSAEFPIQAWECGAAQLTAHWGRSGGVIAVHGEIDADNADAFTDRMGRTAARCEWLVVDLSELEFLDAAGISALQRINTRCAEVDVCWALVPGTRMSRLLRVRDPDSTLPMAGSLASALASVQDSRRLLHSIS